MRKRTARRIAGYQEESRREVLDELAGLAQAENNQGLKYLLTKLKDRGQKNGHAD